MTAALPCIAALLAVLCCLAVLAPVGKPRIRGEIEHRLARALNEDHTLTRGERSLLSALLVHTSESSHFYSLSPTHAALTGVDVTPQLCQSLSSKIEHGVNHFRFRGRTFVGFEYRRVDYGVDARFGTNAVERRIHNGGYD